MRMDRSRQKDCTINSANLWFDCIGFEWKVVLLVQLRPDLRSDWCRRVCVCVFGGRCVMCVCVCSPASRCLDPKTYAHPFESRTNNLQTVETLFHYRIVRILNLLSRKSRVLGQISFACWAARETESVCTQRVTKRETERVRERESDMLRSRERACRTIVADDREGTTIDSGARGRRINVFEGCDFSRNSLISRRCLNSVC